MSMGLRSGPEPDVKKAELKVSALGSGKGSGVFGQAGLWSGNPDHSGFSFGGTIGGPNDNVVTGTFNLYNFRDHYQAKGKIVANLTTANPTAVFTARLLSPKGKLVATIQAIRLSNKNPFPLRRGSVGRTLTLTSAWSKKTVVPGTSVKLTVTIRATDKRDLPAGAAKLIFSVPKGALTDVTGVNVRKCGQHDEKGGQTTVTCIPFDLGAGRRTKVIFLLHVPYNFPGKRLGVGMKLLDANARDPYVITASQRTAIITLQRSGGGATTTGQTTTGQTPPTGAPTLPTEAACQPKEFTMEPKPPGTGQAFNVHQPRFDPPGYDPNRPYVAKCTWMTTGDSPVEAFYAEIDVTPPVPGPAAGNCAAGEEMDHPGSGYYYSGKQYLTIDGGERIQDTQAVGGNKKFLTDLLHALEKQGVGLKC